MAGSAGSAYCQATVEVDATDVVDVIDWTSTLGADMLTNHSDGFKYGRPGCTFNHTAVIGFTTLNLGAFQTSGTPGILVGDIMDSCVLTVENHGAGSVVHTIGGLGLSQARCVTANMSGGHGRMGELQMAFEAVGSGTTEPTVSWVYAA